MYVGSIVESVQDADDDDDDDNDDDGEALTRATYHFPKLFSSFRCLATTLR